MPRNLKLRIWRGDATDGGLKNVEVEANEGEVVLDLIHRVQATQMGDLAVRWNCKAGKCGSCSMEINGKPRLACMTQVASFPEGEEITVDLNELPSIYLDEEKVTRGVNEFEFETPVGKNKLTFKYLTAKDEKLIDAENKGLKRLNKNASADISTRLKHQILSVDGESDQKTIREFIDNYFLARDSSAFRSHIKETQPDVRMTFIHEGANGEEEVTVPMQVQFFWPDARV